MYVCLSDPLTGDPLVAEEEMVDLTYQVFTSFVDLTNNNDSIVVSANLQVANRI